MSRSIRKGTNGSMVNSIHPFSPNLTFKAEQIENVLQPCQDRAESTYLRYELQQAQQHNQQLEMQLQCELNQRVQNEQIYLHDVAILRQQVDDWKMRCQELEIKVRENTMVNQDNIREATGRFALLSIEVERLNQLSTRRLQENESLIRQAESSNLSQELHSIQRLVEDLRNEVQIKQKTIQYLQEQLQSSHRDSKLREQEKNIDQLVSQINALTQILEDKDMQIQNERRESSNKVNDDNKTLKSQVDHCYREIDRLNRIIIQRNQELQSMYSNNNQDLIIQQLQQEIQRLSLNEDWKRNFQELNERFHKVQEQLCFTQAELEAARATTKRVY